MGVLAVAACLHTSFLALPPGYLACVDGAAPPLGDLLTDTRYSEGAAPTLAA